MLVAPCQRVFLNSGETVEGPIQWVVGSSLVGRFVCCIFRRPRQTGQRNSSIAADERAGRAIHRNLDALVRGSERLFGLRVARREAQGIQNGV